MRVWLRQQRRCAFCKAWRGGEKTAWGWMDGVGHDPCIRNLPGVEYACCGHGSRRGYVALRSGGVFRFPGNVHPFLVRAAVNRYRRLGVVPGWAREDVPGTFETLGCRFVTPLDLRFRRRRPGDLTPR